MTTSWRKQQNDRGQAPYSYDYASLSAIIQATKGRRNALVVVLDHITDAGNMGAIARSAEVVGAAGIVIPKARAAQVNGGAFRASAGAVERIAIAREPNLVAALQKLQEAGFWAAVASEHAATEIWDAPLEGRVALVMGSEDNGVSRLVQEACDFDFKLPQVGQTQSLNVAQAATAIMYEWLRRSR
jgi:23S rRNA (guanosine2251-2'-O)-methyltransferase